MRILLLADIHANWPALQAVREPHDVALFLGDLVEYGVEPGPCIEWVRAHCRYGVRGNHDHGTAQGAPAISSATHGFKYLTAATRPLGRSLIGEAERRFLNDLPLTRFLTLNGLRIMMVHATPRDPLDEFAPADPDVWARRLDGIDVDVVCVGHTHQPYAMDVNGVLVVNPGSVGLQREGDPRASYGVIDGTSVQLRRIDYPVEQAVQAVVAATLPDDVKDLLTSVYRQGKLPDPGALNGSAVTPHPNAAPTLHPTEGSHGSR